MKNYFKLISILLVLFTTSCNLDYQDNPNQLKPGDENIDFLLTSSELNFLSLFNSFNGRAMNYTRMQYQFGDYINDAGDFNGAWSVYYAGFLADNKVIKEIALRDVYPHHLGIAQVLEAYATTYMVDFFGDIPYSEALQGLDNPNPTNDKDSELYDKMYTLLDNAIANLEESTEKNVSPGVDVYYGGNMSKWIKLAKTLKLKMYVQTKLFNPELSKNHINALMADNLIENANEDFEFRYGTNTSNPDTRHPYYAGNYIDGTGVSGYMSNSYMYALKNTYDPRLRYYFYRQTGAAPTGANLVCTLPSNPPEYYCYIGGGYWGRDHATVAGIPGDTDKRTTWGLYPAGGKFDRNRYTPADEGQGAGGAGIAPFLLSSFVDFLKAEAVLTIPGVNGDASSLFESALTKSIDKVMSFGYKEGVVLGSYEPTSEQVANFIADRVQEFNDAATTAEKMEILMHQYWIALRGNGIEAYNNYRRTGKPYLQSPLTSGNVFPRVNLYPANHINSNSNATQHSIKDQVFWDTNPAEFID